MLEHGGGLISVAQQYGIPLNQWLDLSTGINPDTWPLPDIPQQIFNRLPEDNDGLQQIAETYYQAKFVLAIPGSQSVIQLLPRLRQKCRVAVPVTGYAEHAYAWRKEGHQVDALTTEQIEKDLHLYDVVVVINPNNPSAELLKPEQLLNWQQRLHIKSGWLIVDEAFIDTQPEFSLAKNAHQPGLIVLRSMGKYFGLAGIRSGFVLAEERLLQMIKNELGPWTVSGPSRYITGMALQDKSWHLANTAYLKQQSNKLKILIERTLISNKNDENVRGTDLFQTLFCDNAFVLHESLAKKAVFTRLLDCQQGVRFALPEKSQWKKLEQVLESMSVK